MIKIRFSSDGPLGISRRQLQKAGREAIRAASEHWWRYMLPIHFTMAGGDKYNYRQRDGENSMRKGSYTWRKAHRGEISGVRSIGVVAPLVWSGTSRRMATTTKSIKARAPNYQKYVGQVAINAPALNFIKKGYDEVTRTTRDEDNKLAEVFSVQFEKQLNLLGRTSKTTTINA